MSSLLADYLNKQLDGVAISNAEVLRRYASDGSILSIMPNVVVQPINTTDVRKVVLLSSQLSQKGFQIGVTARGSGSDKTGASIGKGVVLDMARYLNRIINIDPRQRLVHVQAGVTLAELNKALAPHGLCLPLTITGLENPELNDQRHTIGGLISNNLGGQAPARLGRISDYLVQTEVVLADGSVYHTENLSVRQLRDMADPKKNDGKFEDLADKVVHNMQEFVKLNAGPISSFSGKRIGNGGYLNGLTQIGDGERSFNLMPLLLGAQGTLGIITEVILSVDYIGPAPDLLVAKFDNVKQALGFAIDALKEEPSICNVFDGRLFAEAKRRGKVFGPLKETADSSLVMLVGFDDSSARHRQRKISYLSKLLQSNDIAYVSSFDQAFSEDQFNAVVKTALNGVDGKVFAPILDGTVIPFESIEKYLNGLRRLERLLGKDLGAYGSLLTNLWTVRPEMDFEEAEKQPAMRAVREYGRFVLSCDGILAGEGGEGRTKSVSSLMKQDNFVRSSNEFVKKQFDPRNILNPGVKQTGSVDDLIAGIREDNDFGILEP